MVGYLVQPLMPELKQSFKREHRSLAVSIGINCLLLLAILYSVNRDWIVAHQEIQYVAVGIGLTTIGVATYQFIKWQQVVRWENSYQQTVHGMIIQRTKKVG